VRIVGILGRSSITGRAWLKFLALAQEASGVPGKSRLRVLRPELGVCDLQRLQGPTRWALRRQVCPQ
jgi:hypothetical protein